MVRGYFWISLVLAGAAAAAFTGRPLLAQPAPNPASANDPVRRWVTTLTDPATPEDQRGDAASRLVARRTPASREEVRKLLTDLRFQVVVARRLADDPDPDQSFVDPLFAMLTTPGPAGDPAARALATFKDNPGVLNRLRETAASGPANRPARVRINAIYGLGGMADRTAAALLQQLMTDAREGDDVRAVAAEALANLSGQYRSARDVAALQRWWANNQGKNPQQFRNDLLTARAMQADPLLRRFNELRSDTRNLMAEEYQNTPAADRPKKLQSYLTHTNPVMREEGADIIRQQKLDGKPIPQTAQVRLRQMINDPDPRVRLAVAAALAPLVDAEALDPILQQLAEENDSEVRAQLAKALGPLNDLKAAPQLLELLKGPGPVAAAAADALKDLAPKIQAGDAPLAKQAALALKAAFETTGTPATQGLRESTVAAMANLADPSLQDTLRNALTGANETVLVRREALKGLGKFRNPRNGDQIEPSLKDEDPGVKGAAIDAMRDSGVFSDKLVAMLEPGVEDANNQAKAWVAVSSFFPALDNARLQQIADKLGDWKDIGKAAKVLQQKASNQQRDKDPDLPFTLLNLGLMHMQLKDYSAAVLAFDSAITEQSKAHKVTDAVMVSLIQKKMAAMLKTAKYEDAIPFALRTVDADPGQRKEMGALIKNEADDLKNAGEHDPSALENALKLIAESEKLKLPQPYSGELQKIENEVKQIQARIKGSGLTPPPDGPRSGTARTAE